jgi:hypothetical protein
MERDRRQKGSTMATVAVWFVREILDARFRRWRYYRIFMTTTML